MFDEAACNTLGEPEMPLNLARMRSSGKWRNNSWQPLCTRAARGWIDGLDFIRLARLSTRAWQRRGDPAR